MVSSIESLYLIEFEDMMKLEVAVGLDHRESWQGTSTCEATSNETLGQSTMPYEV